MTFQSRMTLRHHIPHNAVQATRDAAISAFPGVGRRFASIRGPFSNSALPVPGTHAGALPSPPCSLTATQRLYGQRAKRAIDVLGAAVVILLSLPVMLLLLAALWLENGRPLFSQERLGKDGRRFRMYKLRSMVPDAEAKLAGYLAANPTAAREWAVRQKLRNDPRVTRLGWLIRKTSLDELPQLFNVLKGDMSLVGPRPMLPDQLPLYLHPSAYLAVRPGLSGLWQVTARNDESFEIRAEIDRKYVERLSPGLDARILLATARAVLRGTGH